MSEASRVSELAPAARRLVVSGRVQGVGFRPHVWRIAESFRLKGWVRNGPGRVIIHVEGRPSDLDRFAEALISRAPPLARPRLERSNESVLEGAQAFRILKSERTGTADIHLPPDSSCCNDCLAELQNPSERRYRYAFTNCTQCGPRYTIVAALPYDRANTSMRAFALCAACRKEYEDPSDRRYHAQPLACPACGPQLDFHQADIRATGAEAIDATIGCLRAGGIVAVKGIGGYHLMCDAANDDAVRALRVRKHRPDKPLAVMFPEAGTDGLDCVRAFATLTEAEERGCADVARPIVLAARREDCSLSDALAPRLRELGVFLPYSPLHHLVLEAFGGPLVATSGNVGGEPVITDNAEAELRLSRIADAFLHHDRPILRPADDSVVRAIGGKARALRIGRGVAPLEIELPHVLAEPVLAVGGHMKAAIALADGRRAVISPHIGDLDSPRSMAVFEQVIADLCALYRISPHRIVCDAHPGYASARWAEHRGLPLVKVQHHAAHASALAGEHREVGRWLVFTWDGIGLSTDGELWGGEAFIGAAGRWRRAASIRPFHLAGGELVAREPWRCAAALMWEAGRDWAPRDGNASLVRQAWRKRLVTARASSIGRLFDAASSLVLGLDATSFEGQGPMMLESAANATLDYVPLPLARDENGIVRMNWEPLLAMLTDTRLTQGARAGLFHESLARGLAAQAREIAATEEFDAVGLTGGVFQNRLLSERAIALLSAEGIPAFLPELLPPNDGGLAFGQLIETAASGSEKAQAPDA